MQKGPGKCEEAAQAAPEEEEEEEEETWVARMWRIGDGSAALPSAIADETCRAETVHAWRSLPEGKVPA